MHQGKRLLNHAKGIKRPKNDYKMVTLNCITLKRVPDSSQYSVWQGIHVTSILRFSSKGFKISHVHTILLNSP